jgi:hypothetical protein
MRQEKSETHCRILSDEHRISRYSSKRNASFFMMKNQPLAQTPSQGLLLWQRTGVEIPAVICGAISGHGMGRYHSDHMKSCRRRPSVTLRVLAYNVMPYFSMLRTDRD